MPYQRALRKPGKTAEMRKLEREIAFMSARRSEITGKGLDDTPYLDRQIDRLKADLSTAKEAHSRAQGWHW